MSDIVGIDVGVGSIKAIELSVEDDKLKLEAIGETKTPRIDWRKGENKNKGMGEVAMSIKDLLNDLKIRSKKAVACLPEDEIISRLIRLPPLKENEVMDALKFEAETFVPYPLDEVSLDYEVIETDDAGRLTIFAIAARNDLVASYVKLFKQSGLDLIALESPAVSFRRVVSNSVSATAGVLLVDMGEKYSDLVGINKGNVYFTRAMSVGGESLTRAISLNLGLDMASAEEYKKAYGLNEMQLEGKIKDSILPVFSNMAEEIRKAMAYFREDQGKSPEILVLSGGGANLPGLAEELTRILGLEVQVIQPFLRIDATKVNVPFNLTLEGCRFSLCLGLAMRGLVK
jgi:type IV pilus assembly protein PilM